MSYYADSSFLVSCYLIDTNTARARTWLSRSGVPLDFTVLHALEVANAFELGVFRGLLVEAEIALARSNLEKDLASSRWCEER
jgi:hypothetical protein